MYATDAMHLHIVNARSDVVVKGCDLFYSDSIP